MSSLLESPSLITDPPIRECASLETTILSYRARLSTVKHPLRARSPPETIDRTRLRSTAQCRERSLHVPRPRRRRGATRPYPRDEPDTTDNLAPSTSNELFSVTRKHSILVPTTPTSSSQNQAFYNSHRSTLSTSQNNNTATTFSGTATAPTTPAPRSRMPSTSGASSAAPRPRGASNATSNAASSNPNSPPIPISITICGDGGCGKSSITLRLVRSAWTSEYDPTIEDSYSVTRRIDGQTYHLSLTDTAGQEEYRGMWASSNLGADAFLMVYDITAAPSLDALSYFNDLIDMESETRTDNAQRARLAGYAYSAAGEYGSNATKTVAPIKFVAGNKCDLSESRQISAATGLDWARRRGCGFMETSARLEVNIEETFALIVRRVAEARRAAEAGLLPGEEPEAKKGGAQRNATKPLSPLPDADGDNDGGEKDGLGRGPRGTEKVGRGTGGFWKRFRCW